MGGTCCKDSRPPSRAQDDAVGDDVGGPEKDVLMEDGSTGRVKSNGEGRHVRIRRTVTEEEFIHNEEEAEHRRGTQDPDLDALREEAEARSKRQAKPQLGRSASFTPSPAEEIAPRKDEEETNSALMGTKRSKGRKGTGYVRTAPPPDSDDDEDDAAPAASAAPKAPAAKAGDNMKRAKGRKGTGFVKASMVPPSDDEED